MKEIIEKLRSIDVDKITNNELELLLPSLGMNDEKLTQMPPHLNDYYGKGLKFWQYPNQFNEYLKKLSTYEIDSYLEIGSRWGGTFIITTEILKLKNNNIKSYACDIIPMSDVLNEYANFNEFTYINKSSFDITKSDVNEQVDLILVDGFHSYDAVKKDFETSLTFNPKYIVLHDIFSDACPDVVRFWNEIKNNYKHYEYVNQYDNVNGNFLGIGLLEIRNI
jgi:cephalosporin hydroxylase